MKLQAIATIAANLDQDFVKDMTTLLGDHKKRFGLKVKFDKLSI